MMTEVVLKPCAKILPNVTLLLFSFAFGKEMAAATYVDRFDRKHLLLTMYLLFALATLACGLAPGYGFLMVARVARAWWHSRAASRQSCAAKAASASSSSSRATPCVRACAAFKVSSVILAVLD